MHSNFNDLKTKTMTAEELPINMDYRPYRTIEFENSLGSNLMYSEEIKMCQLDNDTHGLYLPVMYAILKVTGEDVLITIDLNTFNKTFMVNIPKNTKCVFYRHKDFNILDATVKCSYY
tara:strand:+ start:609 stop:962 length:354 start_codon:yes stop_codon:yes gene_type:complete